MNRKLEHAFSRGFLLECKNGYIISEQLSDAQRAKWAKGISSVRVWTPNKNKLFLQDVFNKAKHEFKERNRCNHDGLFFHYNQLVTSLRAIIEKENEECCAWMQPAEYEKFYSKGIAHRVDMCRKCFFETYPKAGSR